MSLSQPKLKILSGFILESNWAADGSPLSYKLFTKGEQEFEIQESEFDLSVYARKQVLIQALIYSDVFLDIKHIELVEEGK